jgi:Holliday junction resolvase RusA-like endonuclease
MNSVTIHGKLPSLNEYIEAERTNRHLAAKIKRDTDKLICLQIGRMKQIKSKIRIRFIWCEETKRRDPDNVCFAKKFILDAMQKCGKLKNDNPSWIAGFTDDFVYGRGQGVILEITEV